MICGIFAGLLLINLNPMNTTDNYNEDIRKRLAEILFQHNDELETGCGCGSGCGCHSSEETEMEPCECDCDEDCNCMN